MKAGSDSPISAMMRFGIMHIHQPL